MRKSDDSFRFKAIDYRRMILFFLLVAILVYCLVTSWPIFTIGKILPKRIFFGLLGLSIVYWVSRWSKDLQLFLPIDKPRYTLGNSIEEIDSLQVHTCLSTFFPMKFLRINFRLFIIMPTYKNPFENNFKAIQKLETEVIFLEDYIIEHALNKRNFLDFVPNGINFLFWLLILISVVAMALLLFKIFTY